MTEPVCELIITADDEPWLLSFTRSLVNDRLAACGQLVGPIRSIYRWDNAVQDDTEVRVALHTRSRWCRRSSLPGRASYHVPCVGPSRSEATLTPSPGHRATH